jgi:hypothetical protein
MKATEATHVPPTAVNDFGRMTPASEAPQQDVYRRPRTTSSSSGSPSALNPPRERRRQSSASVYTVPDINIQPPVSVCIFYPRCLSKEFVQSRPSSLRQASEASVADYLNSADADRSFEPATISIVLPDGQLPPGFVASGEYSPAKSEDAALPIPPPFPMSEGYFQKTGLDERPVIPDTSLYGHDSEDDVVSSAMSSLDTLTTPPPSHARRSRVIGTDALPTARSANSSNGHHSRSKHKNR